LDEFKSADDILDFAIKAEERAYDLYMGLASKMEKPAMRKALEEFAAEELAHKERLQNIKTESLLKSAEQAVTTLDIADYMLDVKPNADMDYEQALVLAMKAEDAAMKLYADLAKKTDDENLRQILLNFAREEAKHKKTFENEYESFYMPEN
jgi:rubrerythrin